MVIEALIQRRESIAAYIRQLRENLAHIDAVIKMFQGDTPAKPRKVRGEVTRVMLNAMTYKELNGKTHYTGFAVEISAHLPAAASYNNKSYTYYTPGS